VHQGVRFGAPRVSRWDTWMLSLILQGNGEFEYKPLCYETRNSRLPKLDTQKGDQAALNPLTLK